MTSPSPLNPSTAWRVEAEQIVRAHLCGSAALKTRTAEACASDVSRAAELVANAVRQGGKVLLCGNGGSAADCQHMAAEFVHRLTKELDRPAIAAVALTTDTSFLTAFSNDVGFDGIFARQVYALGKRGDVLVGISTSGGSRNVLQAVAAARECGLLVVALTSDGGKLAEVADLAIRVPTASTQYVQEAHLAIEHVFCHLVERSLYKRFLTRMYARFGAMAGPPCSDRGCGCNSLLSGSHRLYE